MNEIALRPPVPDEYWLLLPILLFPAVGALINGLFGHRLARDTVHTISCAVVFASFALSVVAFLQLAALPVEERHLGYSLYEWFTVTLPAVAGSATDYRIPIELAFRLDALSATMLLVVTGVGSLIHLYSTGYMSHEHSPGRYFAYLNLFTCAMLILILGESLPVMFVGWEGVGLCSYLLIGFWYDKEENARAGMKAFVTNRVGDLGFLMAIFLLALNLGALSFPGMEHVVARQPSLLGVHAFEVSLPFIGLWHPDLSTAIAICLFIGAAGKSAQLPLYVWLPDAMAGPTPVSALIHAATMVTAGVYMVARMHFVYVLTASGMAVVAIVGAATAVFAATIALTQNDIKKVLAYSTISQLGYMFVAVGVGAYVTGIFHVVTHAFFKACLFLGAGSVIHAMGGKQDIREMGGLRPLLPRTHWTFLAATAAIAGFPLTAGFFSKDAILWSALARDPGRFGSLPVVLLGLLLAGAVLTAFYMFRLYFLVFGGELRADEHTRAHLHESPGSMTWPLMILGVLSIGSGFLNPEALHALGLHVPMVFEHWLAPGLEEGVPRIGLAETRAPFELPLVGASSVIALASIAFAWTWYRSGPSMQAAQLARIAPRLHALVLDKWRIDELYETTLYRFVRFCSRAAADFVDRVLVDGVLVNGSAFLVKSLGSGIRLFHTGRVQAYAMFMAVGAAGILFRLAVPTSWPGSDFEHQVRGRRVSVMAIDGVGYQYRWDFDGDGRWDTERSPDPKAHHEFARTGRYRVRLEIENPFMTLDSVEEVEVDVGRAGR